MGLIRAFFNLHISAFQKNYSRCLRDPEGYSQWYAHQDTLGGCSFLSSSFRTQQPKSSSSQAMMRDVSRSASSSLSYLDEAWKDVFQMLALLAPFILLLTYDCVAFARCVLNHHDQEHEIFVMEDPGEVVWPVSTYKKCNFHRLFLMTAKPSSVSLQQ